MVENVIIIGGGPAGLAAAIYNSRANLNPLVFAGSPPGGQLTLTTEVENYPGFESVLGPELVEKMRGQAKKFGARIVDENVVRVDFSKRPFIISPASSGSVKISQNQLESVKTKTDSTDFNRFQPILTKSVLIATGAKALWLGLESETRLRGKGVSACATCDGFFFKGKTVAVVGGGDTAMEEALTLTKFADKVYIIHRRNEFRASRIMQERVLNDPKVEVIWNAVVEEIVGEKKVEAIKLKSVGISQSQLQSVKANTDSNRFQPISTDRILKVDGLFVAIGHKPDTDIFKGQIEMDEKGYIMTAQRKALEHLRLEVRNWKLDKEVRGLKLEKFNLNFQSATSIPVVFAAGDCVDHVYRQAATAVGMGVAAALEIEKWLDKI